MKISTLLIDFDQQITVSMNNLENFGSNQSKDVSLPVVLNLNFIQFFGISSKEILVYA